MDTKYILVLDIGTTNIKAFLIDHSAKICFQKHIKIGYILDQKIGKVEQSPLEIWKKSHSILKHIMEENNIKNENILSLGITAQRSSFLLWDKNSGLPITQISTWQDKQAALYAKKLNSKWWIILFRFIARFFSSILPFAKLKLLSTLEFDSVQSSVRTGYLFQENPEIYQKANTANSNILWGTIDSWILFKLTMGKIHATDYSSASSTGILDPFTLKWNSMIMKLFNIPVHILPQIKNTRDDFGKTLLLGKSAIPIRAIMADQQASLYGQCCFNQGDIKCTNGTGSFVDINTGQKAFASHRRLYPLVAWRTKEKINYMIEGQSQNTGNVIDWLINDLKFVETENQTEEMALSVKSTGGIYFLPAFTTGLTFPYWDSTVRGNLFGLSLQSTKAHIVRAVLEGICFRIKDILEGIKKDTNLPIKRLKIDGGVSQNKFIQQFLANILGIPIEIYNNPEPTALGVAFMAGLECGLWQSEKEISRLIIIKSSSDPLMNQGLRKIRYQEWRNIINRSKNWQNSNR